MVDVESKPLGVMKRLLNADDCDNHIAMLGDHFCKITGKDTTILYDGSYVCWDCPLMKWVK